MHYCVSNKSWVIQEVLSCFVVVEELHVVAGNAVLNETKALLLTLHNVV